MSTIALMAGGTGGHLFPAQALSQELARRGHVTHLFTDERVTLLDSDFPPERIHVVPAATPSIRNPIRFVGAGLTILSGTFAASGKLRKLAPAAAVGFGGYPCFPPFLAASLLGIPGILHEQNAVMGRANRALARVAKVLATSFAETVHADRFALEKVVTGNPVRDRVRAVSDIPYPLLNPGGEIRLLIFGGSQGARVFSEILPPAIAALEPALRDRLRVTQQCRPEDLDSVAEAYRKARVNVELASFFADLPERMAMSHLVIGRAGASTVAELGVIGRPAVLVPLPGSLDQDQAANAAVMARAGGAWLAEQATLSPQSLATQLNDILSAPESLARAASAAKSVGHADAVARLADLVERVAADRT